MRMRPHVTTIMGLALLLACGGGDREAAPAGGTAGGANETGMSADTASTGTPTGEGEASLGGILSRLELANTAEMQTSELATKQARAPAVKRMAEQLLTHHRQNRTELRTLAKQKGVDLVPAQGGSTARDTAGVLALRSLEGADFDTAFVAGQIEAHRTNIDAIRHQMLPAAQDAEVRQFLQKTQAAMEKHLAGLEEIQSQLQR
jgi:putative membrane protein